MENKFWDIKSARYPRPLEPENLAETAEILKKASAMGAVFENAEIVDIGCGTGNYALQLAKTAKKILCVDFSEGMIKVLKQELAAARITNAEAMLSSFADFPAEKHKKAFNLAFASMTPAVKTREDVLKMESLAGNWCVFVGWAGKKQNRLSEEILALHKIKHYVPRGFLLAKEILEKRKINFRSEIFSRSWNWEETVEEAVADISARIELDGLNPDKELIRDFFESRFPGGKVSMTTEALKGLLVWRPE